VNHQATAAPGKRALAFGRKWKWREPDSGTGNDCLIGEDQIKKIGQNQQETRPGVKGRRSAKKTEKRTGKAASVLTQVQHLRGVVEVHMKGEKPLTIKEKYVLEIKTLIAYKLESFHWGTVSKKGQIGRGLKGVAWIRKT